jgi:FkbM family methyltransferase
LITALKVKFRDFLPRRWVVPAKFFFNKILGRLESELRVLPFLVTPGDHVIDVGGNRGVYTFSLWRLGAVVHVFEPNSVCAELLSEWSADKIRVNVYQLALSDADGVGQLTIPLDDNGLEHDASGSLGLVKTPNSRSEMVRRCTLNSLGLHGIRFIKIDVEGNELGVLLGAVELLKTQRPSVLCEIEERHCKNFGHSMSTVFSAFEGLNYKGYFLHDGQLKEISLLKVSSQQSSTRCSPSNNKYINNFIFLPQETLSTEKYTNLFAAFPKACA